MKKTIIIAALMLGGLTSAFGQTKTDTVKKQPTPVKKVFQPDYDKTYTIALQLSANDVAVLTTAPEQWAAIEQSPQMTGQQISQLKTTAAALRQKISALILEKIAEDRRTFEAKKP